MLRRTAFILAGLGAGAASTWAVYSQRSRLQAAVRNKRVLQRFRAAVAEFEDMHGHPIEGDVHWKSFLTWQIGKIRQNYALSDLMFQAKEAEDNTQNIRHRIFHDPRGSQSALAEANELITAAKAIVAGVVGLQLRLDLANKIAQRLNSCSESEAMQEFRDLYDIAEDMVAAANEIQSFRREYEEVVQLLQGD